MSDYNAIQEMFMMNMSSNKGSSQSGPDIEKKVFAKISEYLTSKNLTNWEIVWGPGVFHLDEDSTPDNVMYLAFDKSTSRYFLSVAGTNANSIIDWIEDLDTGSTKKWPWASDDNVQISSGNRAVLDILSILPGQACVNGVSGGEMMSLTTYLKKTLKDASAGSFTIITGGHSLGGALSPMLALWLTDTRTGWDPGNAITTISSIPSAGPTLGTAGFKAYYDSRVPQTTRIHNSLDIVPHAWNTTDLNAIKTLYAPGIGSSACIGWLVDRCMEKVNGIDYEQVGLIDQQLSGTLNTSIIYSYLPNGVNTGLQLDYQHVSAYYSLLGLPVDMEMVVELSIIERIAYWSGVVAAHKTISPAFV